MPFDMIKDFLAENALKFVDQEGMFFFIAFLHFAIPLRIRFVSLKLEKFNVSNNFKTNAFWKLIRIRVLSYHERGFRILNA